MAAPHAFLDILAQRQVRDSYLAGRITLVLSPDLETVFWANGAGARFMGHRTVAESLEAQGGFDAASREQIDFAVHNGSAVPIEKTGHAQNFLANRITLEPWGEVVFLRSVAAAVSRNGLVDLTEGLSDETSEAALLDLSGQVMYADKSFNPALAHEPGLLPLLEEAFHDGGVKKRLLGGEKPYPVGVLRLNKEPPVFLVIAARQKQTGQAGQAETAQKRETDREAGNMGDEKAGQGERDRSNLSPQEQQAFFTIAQRLQQALKAETGPERHKNLKEQALDIPDMKEALPEEETDICAELAAAARIAAAGAQRAEEKPQIQAAKEPETEETAPAEQAENETAGKRDGRKETEAGADAREMAQNTAAAHMSAQAAQIRAMAEEIKTLHYQKDQLNFLLNTMSEAVLILDKAGIVRSGNAAAARIFGGKAEDLPGKTPAMLFAPAAAAALRHDMEQAETRAAGAFLNPGREAEGRRAQGGAVKLRLNFGCLEQGKSYFLLMRDMTRFHDIIAALLRKNNEEAQARLRQSRTLALISHEIRTPLNAVLGMAQFMANEQAGALNNPKYKEYLDNILHASGHIMSLVNDILQMSGDKADWLKMDKRVLSVFNVLNEVLALMIPQANAANIIIRSGVAADLPPVLGDARAVKQILLNLIGNAVHFTPPGGQIIISAHELHESAAGAETGAGSGAAARRILLRISDTGIGMSEEEIAQALRDPLESGRTGGADAGIAAFKRHGQGAGLGLPMTHTLAEANNIRFSLASEPGKGTIAALIFPVAEAADSERAAKDRQAG